MFVDNGHMILCSGRNIACISVLMTRMCKATWQESLNCTCMWQTRTLLAFALYYYQLHSHKICTFSAEFNNFKTIGFSLKNKHNPEINTRILIENILIWHEFQQASFDKSRLVWSYSGRLRENGPWGNSSYPHNLLSKWLNGSAQFHVFKTPGSIRTSLAHIS